MAQWSLTAICNAQASAVNSILVSVLFSSCWFETSIRERRHGWISRWNHLVLTYGESMETTVSGFGTDEILSRRLSKLLRYGLKPVALLVDVPPTVDATVQNINAVTTGRLVGSRPRVCRCTLLSSGNAYTA